MSVFNGADPKKDVENEDDKEIENAIDAKREIGAVEAKLKEVWTKFETEKKRLEVATSKLQAAKQSNDKAAAEKAFDAYTLAKNWVITYAEDIEKMQKDVVALPKVSEVTTKPVLPKFVFNQIAD
jgi:uncharacterized radical SAM superfamily Fe-S cluster-containing enzyme